MRAIRHIAFFTIITALNPAARGEMVLVDFGASNSYRGVSVASPDQNGSYWNGRAPGQFVPDLISRSNTVTTIDLVFTTAVASDSYNGPAGPTSEPPTSNEIAATAFDAAALGLLGATNAVMDFFGASAGTTVKMVLSDLSPAHRYTVTFFGSHKYPAGEVADSNETRTTVYNITDELGNVLVSTNLLVGAFDAHNSNRVATITGLVPDDANRLYIEFKGMTAGNAGYLNCLLLESSQPVPPPTVETVLLDFGNDVSYNGASVVNPDINGRYWNSVWSGAYYPDLVNTSNTASTLDFGFDVAGGTDNYNGPAGAIDTAALGALGGATNAVNDYYTSSRFQIQGLHPYHRYTLTFFGSHAYSTDTSTIYRVYSDSAYTQVVAQIGLNVQVPGTPWLHNSNTVAILTNLSPQASNILYVEFEGNQGADGYLNALKVDTYIPDPTYDSWAYDHPGLGDRYADDDGDGWVNLAEFAVGGNPTNSADQGYTPAVRIVNTDGTNQLLYVYGRRSTDSGLTYRLETTDDLLAGPWTNTGYSTAATTGVINASFASVTNWVPMVTNRTYVRLYIEETP